GSAQPPTALWRAASLRVLPFPAAVGDRSLDHAPRLRFTAPPVLSAPLGKSVPLAGKLLRRSAARRLRGRGLRSRRSVALLGAPPAPLVAASRRCRGRTFQRPLTRCRLDRGRFPLFETTAP